MFEKRSVRTIVLLWLAWAVILIGFQQVVTARFDLKRPDYTLSWTSSETTAFANNDQPYLMEPYLNTQVAWDSEFYLSIASRGYEDPDVRTTNSKNPDAPSLNYAFMPLYPLCMRALMVPLSVFGLNRIATATLAGVIVSLLGTLVAMLGIYSLSRSKWGEDGGIRAAFYLLIFPSGFILAQVYTEGLFLGLTFLSLAFLNQRKWIPAGLLAAATLWVRPGEGLLLVLPFAYIWFKERCWQQGWLKAAISTLAVLAPALSYFAWTQTDLARKFWQVEDTFFGRGILKVASSLNQWGAGFNALFGDNPQAAVFYAIEFLTVLLAVICIIKTWKEQRELALFSLGVLLLTYTSGSAQGMVRYLLAAPSIFFVLAGWGRKPAFDRAWSIASTLLMAMLTILFTFDFWVS
jgi:hypothetical protein